MKIDFGSLKSRDAYAWMISTILPRPIAWVSSVSAEGRTNLAPFSFFQGITSAPPILMFVAVNHRDDTPKDTIRNLAEVPEFVVNLVAFAQAKTMNDTSAPLPYGESEFERFDVAQVPSERVRPPRVAAAPVAFECAVHSITRLGEGGPGANVVFGRILVAHVADSVIGTGGMPDAGKLDLIGRLGGTEYARTTERFSIGRPSTA